MRAPFSFILNNRDVSTDAPPGMLVLDFLRETKRLTGTKEGCREGDCGACVVLVGTMGSSGVSYRAVTSCLMPIAELDGQHLVTIEGLNGIELSSVQQAIAEEGASQCGFCTPGIVVSLTGALMDREAPLDSAALKTALGGHLCRCTGYRSLKATIRTLQDTPTGIDALVNAGELPLWFQTIPSRLRAIDQERRSRPTSPRSTETLFVAGGTDLYVQQGTSIPATRISSLGARSDLRGITTSDTHLIIGAATTFEEIAESELVRQIVPGIRGYMDDIASVQIRNRATAAGNLVNASPIGDLTILLLAFETSLTLVAPDGSSRLVPLKDFYLGYKTLAKRPDELVTAISIRRPPPDTHVSWEKVAKRRSLDIASVNSALVIQLDCGVVSTATLTAGGVAAIPLRLQSTSAWLAGQPISESTVQEASRLAQSEIGPISDIRGSADYKRLLVRQLIWAHFAALFPQDVSIESLYKLEGSA
ncbi:MAG: xanthine dehydrogenase small subunit [Rhodothermales bacterium]|jgi:xanthine dehydrogenase small subunit